MRPEGRRIAIIGGGIAGLCAAVYAQKCGYQADVFEMHDIAGGLATNWHRAGYTFETCLHWLWGSSPASPMHGRWREVCDIDKLRFVDWDEFSRIEAESGDGLSIFASAGKLEAELLRRTPHDVHAIRRFTNSIRRLGEFKFPDPGGGWMADAASVLGNLPRLGLVRELSRLSAREYGKRFADPIVRAIFGEGDIGRISSLAILFSLAWMNQKDAGYAIGGSQAIVRAIIDRLIALGGRVHLGARVDKVLVDRDTAVGIRLSTGDTISADWVISAADGYTTIFKMLDGKYTGRAIEKAYAVRETFPSYLQVSLGVARNLSDQPAMVTRLLDEPFEVDPGTEQRYVSFRIFHFDPTFAPVGKTAVTSFMPTRNFGYWMSLHKDNPAAYVAEKQRIANVAISTLERRIPGIRKDIEVVDVSSPASVLRYTGNWRGSMEGWFIAPGQGFSPLPSSLPGLRRFRMVGQWVMPGGGLPSGPITARPVVKEICRLDHVPFLPGETPTSHSQPPALQMPGTTGAP